MQPQKLRALVEAQNVEFIDLRFAVVRGWQHITLSRNAFDAELTDPTLRVDLGTDTPCRLRPDGDTATLDPFLQHPTLAVICDRIQSDSDEEDPRDARGVARRAERFVHDNKLGDAVHIASTIRFFIFDEASYHQGINAAGLRVDSREGAWRRGRDGGDNLGTQPAVGAGTGALPPSDSLANLRSEIAAALAAMDCPIEHHGHGPATGGQMEFTLAPQDLTRAADCVWRLKYVVRNVAARHGKVATFMPHPLFGDAGSSLTIDLALLDDGVPVWRNELGDTPSGSAAHAVGGLLTHLPGLCTITRPGTNSYRRSAGVEGVGWQRTYGRDSAAAAVGCGDRDGWLTVRALDPLTNPYLSFSAVLMAIADGMKQSVAAQQAGFVRELPDTLPCALRAFEADQEYVTAGDVFNQTILTQAVTDIARADLTYVQARPTPADFDLYFNI